MKAGIALLAEKLGGAALQLRQLPRAWRLVRAAAGGWTWVWLAALVVQGLVAPGIVFISRPLVDAVAEAVRSAGDAGLERAVAMGCAMAALLVAGEMLRAVSDWAQRVQAKRVEDHVSMLIQQQATSVDLAFYEWPEFHDHLHRARNEARHRPIALLANAGELMQGLVALTGLAAILIPYGGWIAAALIASTLPALAVLLRFAVRQHRWRERATPDERRAAYHDWTLTAAETAAEIRAFSIGERLRGAYRGLRTRLTAEELRMARSQAFAEAGASLAALAIAAACLAWMASRAIHGEATLGDVALFYVAFMQGQKMMRALLSSVGMAYYNVLFLGNLFDYLDLRPSIADPPAARPFPVSEAGVEVAFRGVTFAYPGSRAPALRGLDLRVRPGEVAAIVGTNGAGKSTLVKLLCRLYDPDQGCIELGGVDLRTLRVDDVRDAVTVLFQDPVRYNDTVAANIDVNASATAAQLERAVRAAGADGVVARLPRGSDTALGLWFEGGTDLSAGEWQKIALARAILRSAPVIALDEPTSAMDAWTEAGWLDRLRAVARGRTVLVVTHRFTTALRADVIFVMHEGRVVESGSHDELVARGGRYAGSWIEQTRAPADATR